MTQATPVWDERAQQIARQIVMGPRRSARPKPRPYEAREETLFWPLEPWQQAFVNMLPAFPDCAGEDFRQGTFGRPRDLALNYPHIQPNKPMCKVWLVFDLDRRGGEHAHERASLPPPNLIMMKPANGFSHLGYGLRVPVTYYERSRRTSIDFLADIERGMVRRLDADKAFAGHLIKNPLSESWITSHPRDELYFLGELAACLDKRAMKPWAKGELETGLGRNVALFNELRQFAYREVRSFKGSGASLRDFRARLESKAAGLNVASGFVAPLAVSEVNGIAQSVSKWTWRHFNEERFQRFSELQSWRGTRGNAKRWAGHTTAAEQAAAAGISRRTLFNRKAREKQLRQKVALSPNQDKGGLGAMAAACFPGQPVLAAVHRQQQDRAEQIAPFTRSASLLAPAR